MDRLSEAIEILQNGDSSSQVTLIKPALNVAVEKGIIPKHAPIQTYEQTWSAMADVLLAFSKACEDSL